MPNLALVFLGIAAVYVLFFTSIVLLLPPFLPDYKEEVKKLLTDRKDFK